MDLPETSRLYGAAIAAAKFADQRVESRMRVDYTGSLRRFTAFCIAEGYPDPMKQRFVQLPGSPEMLSGGHPHDRWVIETQADGSIVPRGNPTRSAAITQILAGLSKAKKRERTPKRASPMSLAMLTRVITFLETDSDFNETMRLWFSAVCSLAFYGMRRIKEVLLMKKGDIQLGLRRNRTYSLHHLPKEEQATEALTYLERWFKYACTRLNHKWDSGDYAFPALIKVPRGGAKRPKNSLASASPNGTFGNVGVKWGAPMSDSNFTQILNIVANAAGISKNLLGDDIWFTSHCFRRGGAHW
ncbi:uncharacterized protein PITG_06687 [Phytophthora infestans T30-4]|uniref:Tyr recombinase domain-containing protein n=1 Tax=Phytophthora infestans (strain T30-4) TaxID=403677 RepID=D0N5G1_PHYIT|nr:uncharacterized protein PITG_06687 [Phytophthora infestans T30-4]EEY70119.1 conserved hypothetical protein [Phytophthora infestans T30-4]|eukprot:XP_002998766.1 conserved hypothetical protein [Phytophthora infestans T30-4]